MSAHRRSVGVAIQVVCCVAGVFYFTDLLGKPPPELTWDMKL